MEAQSFFVFGAQREWCEPRRGSHLIAFGPHVIDTLAVDGVRIVYAVGGRCRASISYAVVGGREDALGQNGTIIDTRSR